MNITINNYDTLKSEISWSKLNNPTVKALKPDMEMSMEFYNDDDGIKETIDLWLKKLNKSLPKKSKKATIIVKSKSLQEKPKNLVQFKKWLKNNIGTTLYLSNVDKINGVLNQTRKIAKVQSNSFASHTNFNNTALSWMDFGKSSEWQFTNKSAIWNGKTFKLIYGYDEFMAKSGKVKKITKTPSRKFKKGDEVLIKGKLTEYYISKEKSFRKNANEYEIKKLNPNINELYKFYVVPEHKLKRIITPNQTIKNYDFIFEVSRSGKYSVKTYYTFVTNNSIKKTSSSVPNLNSYSVTEKGLKILKTKYPNNAYGDKHRLSSKDLNKVKTSTIPTYKNFKKGDTVTTIGLDKVVKGEKNPLYNKKGIVRHSQPNDVDVTFKGVGTFGFLPSNLLKKEKASKKVIKSTTKPTIKKTIDHYTNEFMLIRRFFNMVRLKKKVSFRKIQLLYMAYEKAVVERKVRKTSTKADLFDSVNKKVVAMFNAVDPKKDDAIITVKPDFYKKLETYVTSKKINYAIALLKRFIGLQGTRPDKVKVQRLIKAIDSSLKNGKVAKDNRLYKDVVAAKKELQNYNVSPTRIKATKQGLSAPKKKTKGLNKPFSQPIAATPRPIRLKSASDLLKTKQVHKHYDISPEFKKILGDIEIKTKDSVAITIDAPQGAMKTRLVFQIGNEFARQGKKILFVSLEEHPTSELFQNKLKEYVTPTSLNRFYPIGELENGYSTLAALIPQFDVVIVDSWNKIAEDEKVDFDKDLRKKFNGKLFVTIFQRTTSGTMRGGAKSKFDGDVILKIKKFEDYKYNYVHQDKNRYMVGDNIYNIYEKKAYDRLEYLETLQEKGIKPIN